LVELSASAVINAPIERIDGVPTSNLTGSISY
jgi:hypothetical protein